ncbi:MAG: GrpB family protein [Blastocatellia bacterium]
MTGLPAGQLHLSPYDDGWQTLFQEEKSRLQAAIGGYVLDLQHIGSTSVPGMPAKPILDIGIAVDNFEKAARCIPLMEQAGYVYRGEYGIARRHYFVKGDPRTHHAHMLEIDSAAWKNHLLFRDYLIRNTAAAREYAELKQHLAGRFASEREAYQAGKEGFIKAVLQKAANPE